MHVKSNLFTTAKERSLKHENNRSVLTINHERRGGDLDTDRPIDRSRKNIEFDSTSRPQETPQKKRNERNKGRPAEEGYRVDDCINSQLVGERQREGLKHDCERRVTSVAEQPLCLSLRTPSSHTGRATAKALCQNVTTREIVRRSFPWGTIILI
ncbi:hypothetical protein K0M31_011924 [Melipona bicolor]|uniref:Uncharacterized protein n=1 Tax=Melipona bicolor TaxID=60889 RepID=A0AA40GBQ4_9HYME|nr:hypothetical protein K0M31_011924 [Melipona bicolor]